jgi:hypothetical protein
MLPPIVSSISSALTIAASLGILVAAGTIMAPMPQDDPQAYYACKALHPERFCRLQHLPSER